MEEVHERTGVRTIPDSKFSQALQPRRGAKRGMPVASPGVARRAERGPWAKFRAYFDLHRNDKLLLAFTPSVSCADSFPNLIRQPSAATFPRGAGNGDAICTSPQLSPRTGKVAQRADRGTCWYLLCYSMECEFQSMVYIE